MKTTKAQLEAIVARINRITKSPLESWTKDAQGKFKANVGNYHLDWAYGGVKLVRMMNDGGGIKTITDGYETKARCAELMFAFIAGLEANLPVV